MRRVLMLAAVTALAVARPETYREKEDFQYSRSSSDEGTKAGYYGAQRGNMGGNYERAHNMDTLAQHQMGGLVRTVQGELGDGANQKSGSVFSAANSRGVYGSGHYDLSNLEGRNFQEGTTFGDTRSQSYIASHNGYRGQALSSANSASYDSQFQSSHARNSGYSGYNAVDNTDQALYANNMQALENLQATKQYDERQAADSSSNSGYYSQSGYHDRSSYGQAAAGSRYSNGYGAQVRLVNTAPVKGYARPGGRVVVPVAAQTYDNSQSYSTAVDQNAINTDTEALSSNDQKTEYQPINNAKNYESSYKYRKEWEKHSTIPVNGVPVAIPTFSPQTTNNELYEETQTQGYEQQEASGIEAQRAHSSHQHSGYNANSASSSHQTAYNSEQQSAVSGLTADSNAASSNAYTHGTYNHGSAANYNGVSGNLNNQVEGIVTKPKSYQSSYSYHKSWERQGDPYIIVPSTNGQYTSADGQTSQRLTSSTSNQGNRYGSNQYQYGHHSHSSNAGADCEENGHIRVARSSNSFDQQSQVIYEGQQSQNLKDFGQKSQRIEDFGQKSQNLEDFGQQSQKLEDLGQHSQNLEDFGQQSQKLEDLGQQSQKLEDFGQQSQKLEDLGQQSQNLENFGQQAQKLEDLGQQSQKLENFGQQSQKLEDLGQQSQNLEKFGQQAQKIEDLGQQSQKSENFGQQSQKLEDLGQQSQNLEDFGQQTQQNQWDQLSQTDLGQQTQNTWSTMETIQNGHHPKDFGGQTIVTYKPASNKPVEAESHVAQENDKPNSHTVLGNSDTSKELSQTVFTGQETQTSQNSFNTHSTNSFYPADPLNHQPFMPHNFYGDSYNYHQYNEGLEDLRYPKTFYSMHNNNDNYNQQYGYGSSLNSYTNTRYNSYQPWTQDNINTNNYGNLHTPISYNSPLSGIWDKLDNIENNGQKISEGETGTFVSNQDNKENVQTASTLETINNGLNIFNTEKNIVNSTRLIPITTEKIDKIADKPDTSRPLDVDSLRGDIEPDSKPWSREDVGRGDIGADDDVSTSHTNLSKPLEIIENKPVSTGLRPNKTPKEIESLSSPKATTTASVHDIGGHTNPDNPIVLSVLSLSERRRQELENKRLYESARVTSTPSKPSYSPDLQIPEEVQVHSTDSKFINLGHQSENVDQQSFNQFNDFGQQSLNIDQQNVNHEMVDFGQQSIYVDQQNADHHQMADFGQQSINVDKQNVDHQMADFGQQSMNVDQQNVDHQMVDFGQQTINVDNQNVDHQMADFGQQSMNVDHQMVDFGQQSINVDKQNVDHQMADFGQQSMNVDQQNVDHQMVDFGQQTINVDNQNVDHQMADFGQQSMNVDHQMVDFGPQSINVDKQKVDHQMADFGQQNINLNHQNVNQEVDLGQQEQTQQESLTEFSHNEEKLSEPQKEQELQTWVENNENIETMEDLNQQVQIVNIDIPRHTQAAEMTPISAYKEREYKQIQHAVNEPHEVTQGTTSVDMPPELTTEKPSFWKRTKDKVSSWFSRS